MRIKVDPTKCMGYGNCVEADPDRFDVDEGPPVRILKEGVGNDEKGLVQRAVWNCPAAALSLSDDRA